MDMMESEVKDEPLLTSNSKDMSFGKNDEIRTKKGNRDLVFNWEIASFKDFLKKSDGKMTSNQVIKIGDKVSNWEFSITPLLNFPNEWWLPVFCQLLDPKDGLETVVKSIECFFSVSKCNEEDKMKSIKGEPVPLTWKAHIKLENNFKDQHGTILIIDNRSVSSLNEFIDSDGFLKIKCKIRFHYLVAKPIPVPSSLAKIDQNSIPIRTQPSPADSSLPKTSSFPPVFKVAAKNNMKNVAAVCCKNRLSLLMKFTKFNANPNNEIRNISDLVQALIDGRMTEEKFADHLQREFHWQPEPGFVVSLKNNLPHLRESLAKNELKIEGIKPPAKP